MFAAMKRSLGIGEWVRRGAGAAVLVAVVAIALGADTGILDASFRRHDSVSRDRSCSTRFIPPPANRARPSSRPVETQWLPPA